MKSIKYIIAGLLVAGLTVSSYATVTVGWSTAEDSYLSDSGGVANDWNNGNTELASGDLLEIGTWGATQPTLTSANIQSELASFSVFASGSVNQGPGTFGISSGATATPTFNGNQIVMIAYNQATSTVSANPGQTEVAVFYVNDSSNPGWLMPADGPSATAEVDVGNLFVDGGTGPGVVESPGATILWGTADYDSTEGGNCSLIDTEAVIAVPEPSSIVLVVLGLLGGIGMIRRRRS